MKQTSQLALGLATLFLLVGSVQADGPVPWFLRGNSRPQLVYRPAPPVPARMETSDDGPQARLIIPRKLLGKVGSPWAGIQPPGDNAVAWSKTALPLAVGLALGLVLLPIGLGKVKGRRLAVACGLLLALTATFFLSQNSRAHQPAPPMAPFKLTGQVTVEVVEEGDAIRLIFNRTKEINTQYGS